MARRVPQLALSDLDAAAPHLLQAQFKSVIAFPGSGEKPPASLSMPSTLLLIPGLPSAKLEVQHVQAHMIDGATRFNDITASAIR